MRKPIVISLTPNTQADDVILSIKLLLSPLKWFDIKYTRLLEERVEKYFRKQYKAIAVNSGRSALYLILKALDLKKGQEIITPSLTCIAIPNSVIWADYMPSYIDVSKSLNIDIKKLSKRPNNQVGAIIVQHNFGVPVDIGKIRKIVGKKVTIIEDLAVSLGAEINSKKVGTMGDVAFLSFGRDKVISSVFGGVIVTKNKALYEKIIKLRDEIGYPNFVWVIRQLLHPLITNISLLLYNVGYKKITLGKMLLFLMTKTKIITKPVDEIEKYSKRPSNYPKKIPGSLSALAVNQLNKLEKFNKKRKSIADFYFKNIKNKNLILPKPNKGAIWTRFPLLSENPKDIINKFKQDGVLIGDWYTQPIYPCRNYDLIGYKKGSCPMAEKYSRMILNLPTYPNMDILDAKRVVKLLNNYEK